MNLSMNGLEDSAVTRIFLEGFYWNLKSLKNYKIHEKKS